MNTKRVQDTFLELAQLMTPNEGNVLGKVFGGAVLSLIDLCASATAQKFAGRVCVTAAFERVDFREPVEIGELLTLRGHVSYTGRTSMEVTIDVFATHLPSGKRRHTNTARVTMVALDTDGRPAPVPTLVCETREDQAAFILGGLRRKLRTSRLAEIEEWTKRLETASDAELSAWVESGVPV
ncbi:MAG: acyl-CoA thioesterase [Fimbriimonadaceae bacterium]